MTNTSLNLGHSITCAFVYAAIAFMMPTVLVASEMGQATTWQALEFDESTGISLPLTLNAATDVYQSPTLAIMVERIECDGLEIVPSRGIAIDPLSSTTTRVEQGGVVYRLRMNFISTIISYDRKTGDYQGALYKLPREKKIVIINYRVRFPDGSLSSAQCVRAEMKKQ